MKLPMRVKTIFDNVHVELMEFFAELEKPWLILQKNNFLS